MMFSPVSFYVTLLWSETVRAKHNYSGGSYSIYYALAVASNELNSDHRFVSRPKQKNKY